ncbi:hypothetical protein [Nostoc sp. CCY 9925]|uniref:hypothetical protein n=1 Tax=Nostoc sp. CCY 9925 TaxID=3103865 RepID=UPI0039C73D4B
MLSNKKVYLIASAYELGNVYDIGDLDEIKKDKEILETLLKFGLKKYTKSQLTPPIMAKKTAQYTLEKGRINRKEIDALVYATSSFWDSRFYDGKEVSRLSYELGLENAYPIGVFLSECGNIHTAIRTAASLIQTGECRNILVVTTDQIQEGGTRIIPPNISIASDAAASCIVSAEKGDFEIMNITQHTNAAMSELDIEEKSEEYMYAVAEGIKQTLWKSMKFTEKQPKDFQQLITNNYNLLLSKTISDLGGFEFEQVYTENIARFAHALASDNLINLCDFLNNNFLNSQDLVLLLGTGTNMWGATILIKT